MFARIIEIDVAPASVDKCIKIVRDRNAPAIAAQPGFNRGTWLVDRKTGRCLSITFWEAADNELESRAAIPGLLEKMAGVLATSQVRQEAFEVVHVQMGWEEPYHG